MKRPEKRHLSYNTSNSRRDGALLELTNQISRGVLVYKNYL